MVVANFFIHCKALEAASCILPKESFREFLTIQNTNFQHAFSLTLAEGLACLQQVTGPAYAAQQSLLSYTEFYKQFYAFERISADPPGSFQVQASPFDVGVFGTDRGGGTLIQDAQVDLLGDLRRISEKLQPTGNVSISDWYLPMNSLFHRLRDAHVMFNNGGTKVDTILNQFIFMLEDKYYKEAVSFKVLAWPVANGSVIIDGVAAPRVLFRERVVKSIAGMEPLRWFQMMITDNPAFNYPYKSKGSRINHLLVLAQLGLAWMGSTVGDTSHMVPDAWVELEDGASTLWSWKWLLQTRHLGDRCQTSRGVWNGTCAMARLTETLQTPNTLYQKGLEAYTALYTPSKPDDELAETDRSSMGRSIVTDSDILLNMDPILPDEAMIAAIKEDAGLRTLLGIPDERVPGTEAYNRALAKRYQLRSSEVPEEGVRTWMLDPVNSPSGATYGYWTFKKDPFGHDYAVVKFTRFYLSAQESGGFSHMEGFIDFWTSLTKASRERGVERLLVDVVGNGGGYVNFAYLVVRAFFPEQPFPTVCNQYDRPIGSLFEAWTQIDSKKIYAFHNDTAAVGKRAELLRSNRTAFLEMIDITRRITKSALDLDLLEYDQIQLIQNTLDTLDSDPKLFSTQVLIDMLGNFSAMAMSFGNPFAENLNGYTADGKAFDPYETVEIYKRGRDPFAKFTAKFRVEDCAEVFTQIYIDTLKSLPNPFYEVLVLSDGLCGSSCDTAFRTAYLLSKQLEYSSHDDGQRNRSINFVTYGGLGGTIEEAKATLSATSFPGGNVMQFAGNLVYDPVFSVAVFGYLAAEWAGLNDVKRQIIEYRDKVPQYPFYASQLPKYAQSELYQNALGPQSLPAEYYFFPTDFYLPDWYYDVRGMPSTWNETELSRLHRDAAQAFNLKVLPNTWNRASLLETMFGGYWSGSRATANRSPPWRLLAVSGIIILGVGAASIYFAGHTIASRRRKRISEEEEEELSGSSSSSE